MSADPRQAAIVGLEPLQRQERPPCRYCGGPLTRPRQKGFCSNLHRTKFYVERHPRIGLPLPEPGQPKVAVRTRVLEILFDRQWHTLRDLSMALGVMETTVSAKLRDLRKAKYGGFHIEHRSAAVAYSKRAHEYRLVKA